MDFVPKQGWGLTHVMLRGRYVLPEGVFDLLPFDLGGDGRAVVMFNVRLQQREFAKGLVAAGFLALELVVIQYYRLLLVARL